MINITQEVEEEYPHRLIPSYVNGLVLCLLVTFVLGIVLNAISIMAILNSKLLLPINILILNLAVVDFIYILG